MSSAFTKLSEHQKFLRKKKCGWFFSFSFKNLFQACRYSAVACVGLSGDCDEAQCSEALALTAACVWRSWMAPSSCTGGVGIISNHPVPSLPAASARVDCTKQLCCIFLWQLVFQMPSQSAEHYHKLLGSVSWYQHLIFNKLRASGDRVSWDGMEDLLAAWFRLQTAGDAGGAVLVYRQWSKGDSGMRFVEMV